MEWTVLGLFTILIALAFDFTNGWHDAANSIATSVATGALSKKWAPWFAAFFNFLPMLLLLIPFLPLELKVADTVSKILHIESGDTVYVLVVMAALLSAILWNVLTWAIGMPSSSSHALIGALVGAGLGYKGLEIINQSIVWEIFGFIFVAPLLGSILAYGIFWMLKLTLLKRVQSLEKQERFFKFAQRFSAALYSMGHGWNDATKTMGIVLILMISQGWIEKGTALQLGNAQTWWIIVICFLMMGFGTALGGWRIINTIGKKLTNLRSVGGFSAEVAGAITLFGTGALGIPVSTTHTIGGAVVGTGLAEGVKAVKWSIAAHILTTWIFTIPVTASMAYAIFWILQKIAL